MTHYLAVIHKEPISCYGVSFPDVPGVTAAGDTLDDAIAKATEALAFASEDWVENTGDAFPSPRSYEDLRRAGGFADMGSDVVFVAIPLRSGLRHAA